MKQLSLYLFIIVGMTMMISSCNKEKDITPNPTPPGPVTPTAPYINVSLSRDTAWFGGSETCSFSSDGIVKYNGSTEVSNPISFNNITAPVAFQLSSQKVVNGVPTGPITTKDVKIGLRTLFITNLCWNFNSNDYGKWTNTESIITNDGINWFPAAIDQVTLMYYPNGDLKGLMPGQSVWGNSHYQLSYVGSDTYINLGDINNPPNLYKIESLTATSMVLSKTTSTPTGNVIWRTTYTKGN